MSEDFNFYNDFYSEDETIHHNTSEHEKQKHDGKKKHRMMDEIICLLKALINIFDIISENINDD